MSENSFPLVVHIKRDSLEDGPGIRTVVFFRVEHDVTGDTM
ncbi:MAG: hypothetical protein PVJ86_07425 [Phycisphaerales bacterium]